MNAQRFALIAVILSVGGCSGSDSVDAPGPVDLAALRGEPDRDRPPRTHGDADSIAGEYLREHGAKLDLDLGRPGSPVVGVKFGAVFGSSQDVNDASLAHLAELSEVQSLLLYETRV